MGKFTRRLRFILNVKRFLPFLFEFFTSKRVPMRKKLFSSLLVIGYFLFPFDAIPDFLAFFGILDDVAVLTFVLQRIVKISPKELKDKYDIKEW
ncbi:YkvA family protein [Aneurinibacillus tyrosinisolvens]|uniref:YkvA family protein n=1 Tax=Aneurinibacillus tyrosinisolvens TaxID=1443435 RepID=UPI00063EDB84|nr:DUF1232 domain-containing protein [Aneurinibacillus tyrosinisolvens]